VVQTLLDRGADVNMRGLGGNSPLHRAASKNFVAIVKILLQAKADIELKNEEEQTPWSCRSLTFFLYLVSDILRRAGADPNVQGKLGVTRLYEVAASGDIDMVRFLIESGVNPSIRTDFGWAPLHWAAHHGKLDCVQALLDANADPNTVSDQSTTPLDMALKANQPVIADVLMNAGA
ncbi:ankyrin, partial [Hypoxylon sp. EC38]